MRLGVAVLAFWPAFLGAQAGRDTLRSRSGATLTGVVIAHASGQPIADVEVSIVELSKNTFTNQLGEFRINDIAPARRVVTIRRVGYAVWIDTIEFVGSRTVELPVRMRSVTALDTVVIVDRAMVDFEERRRLGLGSYLTRVDIDKMQGISIANRLTELRSLRIQRASHNQAFVFSSRGGTSTDGIWCPPQSERAVFDDMLPCGCYAKVFVDRQLMNRPITQRVGPKITRPTPPFDVNTVATMSIEAIEWYAGSTTLPAEFADNALGGCGVLVIHTRRGK